MFGVNLGLHVLHNPAGTFHFVGKVPAELAFESSNPDYLKTAAQCGPGFARKIAEKEGGVFKTLTWATKEEAVAFAVSKGYEVEGSK